MATKTDDARPTRQTPTRANDVGSLVCERRSGAAKGAELGPLGAQPSQLVDHRRLTVEAGGNVV